LFGFYFRREAGPVMNYVAPTLDDAEALAIIEQMLAVYPFPKRDKTLEYIDLS
jgi:hypothetical protein